MKKFDIRKLALLGLHQLDKQEVQDISYRMLKRFAAFCDSHELRYTLSGGTLLGAVRHDGFIPWDDDIDIDMPFPDFQRCLEAYDNDPTLQDLDFLYQMKDNGGNFVARLMDPSTFVYSSGRDFNRALSVWIDVLPIFALSDDEEEAQEQLRIIFEESRTMYRLLRTPFPLKKLSRWRMLRNNGNYLLQQSLDRITQVMSRYPFGSTRHVHSVYVYKDEVIGDDKRERWRRFPTEVFTQRSTHRFVHDEFAVPEDYQQYLTILYGPDYMTPPPPHKCIGHKFQFYRKR